jgi:hypothetical protein
MKMLRVDSWVERTGGRRDVLGVVTESRFIAQREGAEDLASLGMTVFFVL